MNADGSWTTVAEAEQRIAELEGVLREITKCTTGAGARGLAYKALAAAGKETAKP